MTLAKPVVELDCSLSTFPTSLIKSPHRTCRVLWEICLCLWQFVGRLRSFCRRCFFRFVLRFLTGHTGVKDLPHCRFFVAHRLYWLLFLGKLSDLRRSADRALLRWLVRDPSVDLVSVRTRVLCSAERQHQRTSCLRARAARRIPGGDHCRRLGEVYIYL